MVRSAYAISTKSNFTLDNIHHEKNESKYAKRAYQEATRHLIII